MSVEIWIGEDQVITPQFQLLVQLVPNSEGIQPVEWCQTCGNDSTDLYWNGKQSICIPCSKTGLARRKTGTPWIMDDSISLEEFFARLEARKEIYGSLEKAINHY